MPDRCTEDLYVCSNCQKKKKSRTKRTDDKTAFDIAQEKLRPLKQSLIAIEKENQKKGGYALDHLLEQKNRLKGLIEHVFEITRKLQRPPQDLQELILCAVSIQPLGYQDTADIACCFGFKDTLTIKSCMMDLVNLGKARLDRYHRLRLFEKVRMKEEKSDV